MNPSPSSSLPLQTLSDNGQAPSKRVSSAEDAQMIVSSLVGSNRERARFNAKIKGMLDGNPPYDAAKLRANAQSYRANINFMEGESALSAALVPYYDLFAGSQHYCEVRLYLDNPDDQEYKSAIVTEEFDCLLKKYQGFEFNMNGVLHDYVAFGKGFVMFPKKWGWHFQRVSFNRVFVPDGAEASVEKLELGVVRERMQLHTLWGYIKDRNTAAKAGWHTTVVADAIRGAMPEEREGQTNDALSYEYVQQKMRDRDIVEGTRQPTVQVAHLLVKEFDGTITHQIVEEAQGPADNSGNSPKPLFLFEKRGLFKNMRETLSAFFFETLDGSWNGARGLGHKIYSSMEVKNRLLCKIVDNSFLASGVNVQAKTAGALQKANLVQVGNMNVFPMDFDIIQGQLFADSTGLIGTNQLLDQTISSNTGIFKAKIEKGPGNPITAREAEIRFSNATTLSNSGTARFYNQLDPFYAELYRRVTTEEPLESDRSEEAEAVREFRKRCKKRGVMLEELRKVESVKAFRNIGNGSQQQRTQALERFAPYVPMLPESGKQHWMESLVASEFGQGFVRWLVPPRDKQLLPNDQQAMAILENAALRMGAPVAWTPTQNNVIHATEHLKAMSGAAESLQGGAQGMDVLAFFEAAGPHVQLHMDKLASDPSRKLEFNLLNAQFKQLAGFADTLRQHIQDQQEAAQQQQQEAQMAEQKAAAIASGQDPETAVATAKARHDMMLKEAKARQQMELKQQAHSQKLTVKDLDFAQKLKQNAQKEANATVAP